MAGDLNGDGVWQKRVEPLLLGVAKGAAIAFFSAPAGDFPVMTGLAVGDGFSGTARVEGTVATLVDAMGNFTPTEWQHARIAKLIFKGDAGGDLLAGGGIQNVIVQPVGGQNLEVSFVSVRAGSAVDAAVLSLNGGGKFLDPEFTGPTVKTDGADIRNLRLPHGAGEVIAGDGFLGGRGGDLNGLFFGGVFTDLELFAGEGSEGDGEGGRGGNVSGVDVKALAADLTIVAGNGASGDGGRRGGGGGKVSGVDVASFVNGDGLVLNVTGGSGGDGSYDDAAMVRGKTKALWGGGGDGGDVSGITIDAPGRFANISLVGGVGGKGAFHAKAGPGGDVRGVKVAKLVEVDGFNIAAQIFTIAGGRGGDGDAAGALEDVASGGGRGGNVSGLLFAGPVDMLNVNGGSGGNGDGHGAGARGGNIREVGGNAGQVAMLAGAGGGGALGGAGGDVIGARFLNTSLLLVSGGKGGDGAELTGGNGGDLKDIRGKLDEAPTLYGGMGGAGIKRGGEGGEISHAVLIVTGFNGGGNGMGGAIIAGDGGAAGPGGVAGGGGALRDFRMVVKGFLTQLPIIAGNGGDAGDAGGRAGAGGVIAGLLVNIETGNLQVLAGNAGSVGDVGRGGGIGVSRFSSGASGQVTLFAGVGTNGIPGTIGPNVFVNGRLFS